MENPPVCLVIGAGDGTGSAIARRFAGGNFTICAARRHKAGLSPLLQQIEREGGTAHGFALDAADEQQVMATIGTIEKDIGPIDVAVYNVGGFVKGSITELSSQDFRQAWEANCFGAFVMCRELARVMTPRARGTILITGATASLRGSAGFAALAGAKHATRALAQSVARELGPKGVHVAHIIIDGGIDTPAARARYAALIAKLPPDGMLKPDDIAQSYWQLHQQPRSAWTHELDLRPWVEKW